MAIPYNTALSVLEYVARQHSGNFSHDEDFIPITKAVGRISKFDCRSPCSTPAFDTSAMDGFAVSSEFTKEASVSNPVKLRTMGIIAAGDRPIPASSSREDEYLPCVEIATGAPFPFSTSLLPFDACIRIEDTIRIDNPSGSAQEFMIYKPATRYQNRRFAGTDFPKNDLVISEGSGIKAHHVMALASLGISRISVFRRLRAAVLTTGSELLSYESDRNDLKQTRDSNGPYLQAALTELGVDVTYLGIMEDDQKKFEDTVRSNLTTSSYDVFITTGAVSMGRFDIIRSGLDGLKADVLFHKVAIRPGHPVLFATIPSQHNGLTGEGDMSNAPIGLEGRRNVPFFGLPGNPLATVACLRFLVVPYLRFLHGQPTEIPTQVRWLVVGNPSQQDHPSRKTARVVKKPEHLRVFWHGNATPALSGAKVDVNEDQGSNKIRPLIRANCWIVVSEGCDEVKDGDVMDSFPLLPSSLGNDDQ